MKYLVTIAYLLISNQAAADEWLLGINSGWGPRIDTIAEVEAIKEDGRLLLSKQSKAIFGATASWSPNSICGELGLDLNYNFPIVTVEPNIKLAFTRSERLSVYFQWQFAIKGFDGLVDIGFGPGLGIRIGILDNLAVELHSRTNVFFRAPGDDVEIDFSDLSGQLPMLTIMPAITIRTIARF